MKTKEQLSDDFLKEVVSVLGLGDFRFTKETMNTKVEVELKQKLKLKQLCEENKDERIRYNEFYGPNKRMNINWSFSVLNGYFNFNLG